MSVLEVILLVLANMVMFSMVYEVKVAKMRSVFTVVALQLQNTFF